MQEEGTAGTSESPNLTSTGAGVPEKTKRARKFPSVILKVIIVLVFLSLLAGAGFYLLNEPKIEEETNDEVSYSDEEPSPFPEITKEPVDKTGITIEILNGTGIEREASFLQDRMGSLGYTSIETGNAQRKDYEISVVSFSSLLDEDVIKEVTEELKKVYVQVKTETHESINDYDIKIITGLRAGQTFPTATPVPEAPTPTSSPSATVAPEN